MDNRYILTILEDSTRFLKAIPIPNVRQETIATNFMSDWVSVFGYPKQLLCDNGKQLIGSEMTALIERGNGEILATAPYSPEQNAVERVHRTLLQRIRALKADMGLPWTDVLPMAVHGYNMTMHTMTKCTPFELMFAVNTDIVQETRTSLVNGRQRRQEASLRAYTARQRVVDRLNSNKTAQELRIGDLVYVVDTKATKLDSRMEEDQCRIIKLIGSKLVQIEDLYGVKRIRNRKHVVLLRAKELTK